MNEVPVDPLHWSAKQLILLGNDVIHELALRAAGTSNAFRLVAGRCLVAMEETRLYEELGFSGSIHYAIQVMGVTYKEACCLRRVARQLEELPRMTKAAEQGQIPWSKLRSISSKATADTEEFWIELASRWSCTELNRLVSATEFGKLPWDDSVKPFEPKTRVQFTTTPESGELFERAVQALSQEAGKRLTAGEVLEHLSIECLAKRKIKPELVDAYRTEASRGVAAAKRKHGQLVLDAQQLAAECGLGDQADDLLQRALGADIAFVAEEVETDLLIENPTASRADQSGGSTNEDDESAAVRPTWDGADGCQLSRTGPALRRQSPDLGGVRQAAEAQASDEVAGSAVHDTGTSTRATLLRRGDEQQNDSIVGWAANHKQVEQTEGGQQRAVSSEEPLSPISTDPEADARQRISALLEKAVAEKKFFVDLDSEDWQNSRLRYNPVVRLVTPAQRKEILRRDGFCCSTPGCPNHLWLEIHHAVFFSRRGETVRANLVSLCSRCHRNVHNGHLTIEGNADRGLIFRDADGRDLDRVYATMAADWLNFRIGWRGEEHDRHQPYLAKTG